jgi:hypothetical protein
MFSENNVFNFDLETNSEESGRQPFHLPSECNMQQLPTITIPFNGTPEISGASIPQSL